MDWKDALKQFRDDNPGLPEGTETETSAAGTPTTLPRLDVMLDRKGRKGKTATIIAGFDPDDDATLREVASRLKTALATGGSARGGEILIQGDRRQETARLLTEMGYKSRLI